MEKKTVYSKNINNSINMQRMNMKIYKIALPDINV